MSADKTSTRKISKNHFVADVRSGLTDTELMQKYRLSRKQLFRIYEKLLESGHLTRKELKGQSVVSSGKVELPSKCPLCGTLKPYPSALCPKCSEGQVAMGTGPGEAEPQEATLTPQSVKSPPQDRRVDDSQVREAIDLLDTLTEEHGEWIAPSRPHKANTRRVRSSRKEKGRPNFSKFLLILLAIGLAAIVALVFMVLQNQSPTAPTSSLRTPVTDKVGSPRVPPTPTTEKTSLPEPRSPERQTAQTSGSEEPGTEAPQAPSRAESVQQPEPSSGDARGSTFPEVSPKAGTEPELPEETGASSGVASKSPAVAPMATQETLIPVSPKSQPRQVKESAAPAPATNGSPETAAAISAPLVPGTPTAPMSERTTPQPAEKTEVRGEEALEAPSPQHVSSRSGIKPAAPAGQPAESDHSPKAPIDGQVPTLQEKSRLLITAIARHDYRTVTALLDEGGDANVADEDGVTALMHAVKNGDEPLAALLLEHGADAGSADKEGATALDIALDTGRPRIIQHIISRDPQKGAAALAREVKKSRIDQVQLLLNAGANINSRDALGNTPLMLAVETGDPEMVELLLAKGADTRVMNKDGVAALAYAYSLEPSESAPLSVRRKVVQLIKQSEKKRKPF